MSNKNTGLQPMRCNGCEEGNRYRTRIRIRDIYSPLTYHVSLSVGHRAWLPKAISQSTQDEGGLAWYVHHRGSVIVVPQAWDSPFFGTFRNCWLMPPRSTSSRARANLHGEGRSLYTARSKVIACLVDGTCLIRAWRACASTFPMISYMYNTSTH